MNKIRNWLLRNLLTQDEKYLLTRAIDDRVDNMRRISVNERWADKDEIEEDCSDYIFLRAICSTKDYR